MKKTLITIAVLILIALAGWAYWHFMTGTTQVPISPENPSGPQAPGFQPLNTGGNNTGGQTQTNLPQQPQAGGQTLSGVVQIPSLRLLSGTPIGGYGASTTGATTTVRWIDRGRGNVYEASSADSSIKTLSNTLVPKVFLALWNKNLTSFIGSLYDDGNLSPTTIYADLVKQGATATSSALYSLKGSDVRGDIIGYAVSPDRSRFVIVMNEGGNGVGYVASFSGKVLSKLFSTPMTQVNVDWPTDSSITLATKGSAASSGFFYSVDSKTSSMTKILGPISGLSAIMSHDGSRVLYSSARAGGFDTQIYTIKTGSSVSAVIKTLADKCSWGRSKQNIIYCGVPTQVSGGNYPDDWYFGSSRFSDKIWSLDASSGEVRLIGDLVAKADRSIDAYRLDTDPKDNYLFFMNKNDLSFWSLSLAK